MYLYEVWYNGDKWLVVAETFTQAILKWKKTVYEKQKLMMTRPNYLCWRRHHLNGESQWSE